jgi:hypothetical protein
VQTAVKAVPVALQDRIDEYVVDYVDLPSYGIKYSKKHVWRLIREGKFPKALPNMGTMKFTHGAIIKHVCKLQQTADKK